MTNWARFWLLTATVLFLASTSATIYFITREAKVEKALPIIEKVGSPCRTAKVRALANRGPEDAYWDAIRRALHSPECQEQSDLVIWSYCLRHGTPPDLCDLPEGLRPARPQDEGEREGGDASSPPQGNSQPGAHGNGPVSPPPILPQPLDDVLKGAQEAAQTLIEPVCAQVPAECPQLPTLP